MYFQCLVNILLCPHVGQDAINREDKEFVEYLRKNGFDVSKLGEDSSSVDVDVVKDTDSAEKISETIEVGQKLA